MKTEFASYVIVAWFVLAVVAFASFPPRRGILVILFSGMLFLPQLAVGAVELGPIKFTNANAVYYAMLLVALLYDADRLFAITPCWADLPVLIWCVCPLVTALLNDPPPDGSGALRDGLSSMFIQTTHYLFPYVIGRAYFSDADGLRELVAGTVIAGLVYVPLCLYEVRMSPQLHNTVYGYMQHSFIQQVRFGGYRPMVFMSHGLTVAFFMAMATVLAAWIRGTSPTDGSRRWAIWALAPTLLLCKTVGAIFLAVVGLGLLWLARTPYFRAGLLALAAVPPAYCITRATGSWDGTTLVDLSSENIDQDRAQSLEFRLLQENQLIEKALQRPVFGWGGWGRGRVKNEQGKDISVTDGLWIILLGSYGIVGLTTYGAIVLLPVVRYARLVPGNAWTSPPYAAATGCAVVVGLWCVDCLPNAMAVPLFIVMVGGLARVKITAPSAEPER